MSIGEGGYARLVSNDGEWIMYEYLPYSLNIEHLKENFGKHDNCDGLIMIKVSSLVEPDIHEKIKRWPSGRKELIVKRIHNKVDYDYLLSNSLIKVENSKSAHNILPIGIDVVAMKIIFKIFDNYQDTGVVPDNISLHY